MRKAILALGFAAFASLLALGGGGMTVGARTAAWGDVKAPPSGPKIYLYSYGLVGEPIPEVPKFCGISSYDLSFHYDDDGKFVFDADVYSQPFTISEMGNEFKSFCQGIIDDSVGSPGYYIFDGGFSLFGGSNGVILDNNTASVVGGYTMIYGSGNPPVPPFLCFSGWLSMSGSSIPSLRCLVFDHRID